MQMKKMNKITLVTPHSLDVLINVSGFISVCRHTVPSHQVTSARMQGGRSDGKLSLEEFSRELPLVRSQTLCVSVSFSLSAESA